jgi:hypothetical protein
MEWKEEEKEEEKKREAAMARKGIVQCAAGFCSLLLLLAYF